MKTRSFLFFAMIFIFSLQFLSCKKEEKTTRVDTLEIRDISTRSAVAKGVLLEIVLRGKGEFGFVYSKVRNPSTEDHKLKVGIPDQPTEYVDTLKNLDPATQYYLRAYVVNEGQIQYGQEIAFITLQILLAGISTLEVTDITSNSALCGGNITESGHGSISARGVCWSTNPGPTLADSHTADSLGPGTYSSNINGLLPNNIYYVRAYATNDDGTAYGQERQFSTLASVTTASVTSISYITAICGGEIQADGNGIIVTRGICWATTQNPALSDNYTVNGNGTGSFNSSLLNLTLDTRYYVRAYATNSSGTAYGNQVYFNTLKENQISDVDGHVYNTVTLGSQVWMAENLRTTHYRDGTSIPYDTQDLPYSSGAYCYYNNNSSNGAAYGALYDFFAGTSYHKLCPTGWHVPTKNEFDTLLLHIGASEENLYDSLIVNGSSGFDALLAGLTNSPNAYAELGEYAGFWTSSTEIPLFGWYLFLYKQEHAAGIISNYKSFGFSVRCVKDN